MLIQSIYKNVVLLYCNKLRQNRVALARTRSISIFWLCTIALSITDNDDHKNKVHAPQTHEIILFLLVFFLFFFLSLSYSDRTIMNVADGSRVLSLSLSLSLALSVCLSDLNTRMHIAHTQSKMYE